MKCQVCDGILNDEESKAKDERTGAFLDLCNQCLSNLYEDLDEYATDDDPDSDLANIVAGSISGGHDGS